VAKSEVNHCSVFLGAFANRKRVFLDTRFLSRIVWRNNPPLLEKHITFGKGKSTACLASHASYITGFVPEDGMSPTSDSAALGLPCSLLPAPCSLLPAYFHLWLLVSSLFTC
jgi:hypothetical protein